MQKVLPELGIPKENIVFISGIGCSSRFPYYMDTYGIHSIHGRAPTLATGLAIANPELSVWVITGDGDGLSIGGNHLIHACRRNLDVTYILMDNEIYGLTKGQVAPTTPIGDITKSTYWGNPEPAFDPCELAISTGATWVGRGFSGDMKGMTELITKAIEHNGFSFLNAMSPCVTWRGDDEFKRLKAMHQTLPEDHDPSKRSNAIAYTRETDVMTTGVLYEVEVPTMIDRVEAIKKNAMGDKPAISTKEILKNFYPSF